MHTIQKQFKEISVTDKNDNDLSDCDLDPISSQTSISVPEDIKKPFNNSDCKIFFFLFLCLDLMNL